MPHLCLTLLLFATCSYPLPITPRGELHVHHHHVKKLLKLLRHELEREVVAQQLTQPLQPQMDIQLSAAARGLVNISTMSRDDLTAMYDALRAYRQHVLDQGRITTTLPPEERPRLDVTSLDRNVTAMAGEKVVLPCRVINRGPRTVSWLRRGTPLTIGYEVFGHESTMSVQSDGEEQWDLVINHVTKADTGPYTCQVSTKRPLKHKIRLTVTDVPDVKVTMTGNFIVNRGDKLELLCFATDPLNPPSFITWFKDGDPITEGRGVSVQHFPAPQGVASRLEVSHATKRRHSGIFICKTDTDDTAFHTVTVLNLPDNNGKRLASTERNVPTSGASRTRAVLFTPLLLTLTCSLHVLLSDWSPLPSTQVV